ncbi:hypothetical protein [Frankia sp. CiP3]|uniref:hypothetical protein n=1 Tax=Frankia sp. CiP3 TaxID=2880971 RepID=UPI001EF74C8F|nr:hypothetical protein [Frankia sp. CiP3]
MSPEVSGEPAGELASKCLCGCGSNVRAEYLPGHDSRHKSALIRSVLAAEAPGTDDATKDAGVEAYAVILRRGWVAHLDKSRQVAQRNRD